MSYIIIGAVFMLGFVFGTSFAIFLIIWGFKTFGEKEETPPTLAELHILKNEQYKNQKVNGIRPITTNIIKEKQKITGFNLDGFSFKNMDSSHKKDKVLNNCVDSKLGLHIFNCAFKTKQKTIMEIVPEETEVKDDNSL